MANSHTVLTGMAHFLTNHLQRVLLAKVLTHDRFSSVEEALRGLPQAAPVGHTPSFLVAD